MTEDEERTRRLLAEAEAYAAVLEKHPRPGAQLRQTQERIHILRESLAVVDEANDCLDPHRTEAEIERAEVRRLKAKDDLSKAETVDVEEGGIL